MEALAAADPEACAYATDSLLAQIDEVGDGTEEGCREAADSEDADEEAEVEVVSSETDGAEASVELEITVAGESDSFTATLTEEDGVWLVDDLEAPELAAEAADADAKARARTTQTAIETYATDNNGSYEGATASKMARIEPTLQDADIGVMGSEDGYTVGATSETGTVFQVKRGAEGNTFLLCSPPGEGGCPESGDWSE
jgi:hypothetical protein